MKIIYEEGDECPYKDCNEKLEIVEYDDGDESVYLECPTQNHYSEYLGMADDLNE